MYLLPVLVQYPDSLVIYCGYWFALCVSAVPPRPFSVSPCTASLAVAACMQVTVDFTPRRVGDHTAELAISYNTGESAVTYM